MIDNNHSNPSTRPLVCRGVRGATTVKSNDAATILTATRELLFTMIRSNHIDSADVSSAIFTVTPDLDATFPATAARQLGWYDVPLICMVEIGVPGSLKQCVRILLHWNTPKNQQEIKHVYLHESTSLRPDKDQIPPVPAAEIEAYMAWLAEHGEAVKI
ncbi:MAG: chorismate mutase [Ardenticatenaceae bacterium]|nr:chorismate mutase [Ardenticatenaceae bacterium]